MNDGSSDAALVSFLRWALPQMGMRWAGYRRVRRQVGRRIRRRVAELGLDGLDAYRKHLDGRPEEWALLDRSCRVTISRFYRDRAVFDVLRRDVLPALAEQASGEGVLDAWSAGCASGEEAWTLAVLWKVELEPRYRDVELRVLATDADATMLERARKAVFPASSLRELPDALRSRSFDAEEDGWRLRDWCRGIVAFRQGDLRQDMPPGPFRLVLCRNLVLTYYDEAKQRSLLDQISARLCPGGALVVGVHESLPDGVRGLAPWGGARSVYRRTSILNAGGRSPP